MAKADNNKETGVEKTPVLTEGDGLEITSEMIAELHDKNAIQEETLKAQAEKIAELEETVKDKNKIIAESQGIIDDYKEIVSDKDAVIAEDNKLIEAQKEEIVQLLKDQAELNKLIPDGVSDDYGLQIHNNEDLVVIRFLLSPAGRFKLPYNVGQEVALHKEVAAEIVESAYAEYVVEVE
ncbi:hypothetical protein [Myroides odoratimimus]|uniref:hypothetical protein n=1 Tax=Myroides odoratimimus TaxID=76832 RepID=UPI0025788B0B|nr:hypothetical protein [Myroides odoratimimus]MDM1065795.1 hypothetical protein [Myroides odoratimimus]MDM1464024.1 hypothetical protein [Myroides odoratimimus]MDM1473914.1 hypothetical protein [Myroides odoratimimus]